jgi:branched-chain amino acid transport system permease protein/neutral amino acid transport system permease protein
MPPVLTTLGFGIQTASILAIAAVGFTVQFGVTNVLNLAYGDVMTASAFAAYSLAGLGLGGWWGLLIGGLFGAVFSFALNRFLYAPFIRRGASLFVMIIVTISVSLILQNLLQAIWGSNFVSLQLSPGATIHPLGMVFTVSQLYIVLIAIVCLLAFHGLLTLTKLGKAMRATAADPELARNSGIDTRRITSLAWLLSGFLCGLAGVALTLEIGSFDSSTGAALLVPIIAAAVLGGVGHPYGAMLGALVIGIATEYAATIISPTYKDAVAFAVLIVMLLVRPQGLLAEVATTKAVAA